MLPPSYFAHRFSRLWPQPSSAAQHLAFQLKPNVVDQHRRSVLGKILALRLVLARGSVWQVARGPDLRGSSWGGTQPEESQTARDKCPPPACPRTWQWGCGLEQPMAWPLFSKICTHLYLGPSSVIWSAQVSRTLRMSYAVKERSIEMSSLSSLVSFSPHWQKRTGTVMRGSVMSLHG